jgi:hypothetical protein
MDCGSSCAGGFDLVRASDRFQRLMSRLATRVAAQRPGLLIPFALIFVYGRTIHFRQGWFFWLSLSKSP